MTEPNVTQSISVSTSQWIKVVVWLAGVVVLAAGWFAICVSPGPGFIVSANTTPAGWEKSVWVDGDGDVHPSVSVRVFPPNVSYSVEYMNREIAPWGQDTQDAGRTADVWHVICPGADINGDLTGESYVSCRKGTVEYLVSWRGDDRVSVETKFAWAGFPAMWMFGLAGILTFPLYMWRGARRRKRTPVKSGRVYSGVVFAGVIVGALTLMNPSWWFPMTSRTVAAVVLCTIYGGTVYLGWLTRQTRQTRNGEENIIAGDDANTAAVEVPRTAIRKESPWFALLVQSAAVTTIGLLWLIALLIQEKIGNGDTPTGVVYPWLSYSETFYNLVFPISFILLAGVAGVRGMWNAGVKVWWLGWLPSMIAAGGLLIFAYNVIPT